MKPVKIILDTDIGDDIDDAFALAFACFHPDISLQGVTTVFKHTQARAHQVSMFLHTIGMKDIHVYKGIEQPLLEPIHYFENDKAHIDGLVYPPQYEEGYKHYPISDITAVDFIIDQSFRYPSDIVIVPIGPLTNIAHAIKKDSTLPNRIKKIVLMGGWFTEKNPEWNILCDPEAADIVFRSGINIYAVGLDVTLQCSVDASLLDLIQNNDTPYGKLLSLWFNRWKEHFNFEKSVMHDPLAVATLISHVCHFELKKYRVDLQEKRGAMILDDENGSFIHVATTVDKEKFYQLFKSTIYKQ